MKKVLSVVVLLAACTGLTMQPALAKRYYHHHHGHSMMGVRGSNAELRGNNANSATGSNSAVNIKGGNNGLGR